MTKERKIEIIILFFLFLFFIMGTSAFVHYKIIKPNTYNISFLDIDSVVKGSPVRFMGINVGHVTKLKREDGYIICKIRITKKGVKLPDGTRAKVTFNGLAGSKSIELLPPLTNYSEAKGIVAAESLRIHDFVGVIRGLKDLCVTMNNIVQDVDEKQMAETMQEITNTEAMTKVDNAIQKITEKDIRNKTNKASSFINYVNNLFKIRGDKTDGKD